MFPRTPMEFLIPIVGENTNNGGEINEAMLDTSMASFILGCSKSRCFLLFAQKIVH